MKGYGFNTGEHTDYDKIISEMDKKQKVMYLKIVELENKINELQKTFKINLDISK